MKRGFIFVKMKGEILEERVKIFELFLNRQSNYCGPITYRDGKVLFTKSHDTRAFEDIRKSEISDRSKMQFLRIITIQI